jgi:hypothetical protein
MFNRIGEEWCGFAQSIGGKAMSYRIKSALMAGLKRAQLELSVIESQFRGLLGGDNASERRLMLTTTTPACVSFGRSPIRQRKLIIEPHFAGLKSLL